MEKRTVQKSINKPDTQTETAVFTGDEKAVQILVCIIKTMKKWHFAVELPKGKRPYKFSIPGIGSIAVSRNTDGTFTVTEEES